MEFEQMSLKSVDSNAMDGMILKPLGEIGMSQDYVDLIICGSKTPNLSKHNSDSLATKNMKDQLKKGFREFQDYESTVVNENHESIIKNESIRRLKASETNQLNFDERASKDLT